MTWYSIIGNFYISSTCFSRLGYKHLSKYTQNKSFVSWCTHYLTSTLPKYPWGNLKKKSIYLWVLEGLWTSANQNVLSNMTAFGDGVTRKLSSLGDLGILGTWLHSDTVSLVLLRRQLNYIPFGSSWTWRFNSIGDSGGTWGLKKSLES